MIYAKKDSEGISLIKLENNPFSSENDFVEKGHVLIAQSNTTEFEKKGEWRFLKMLEYTDSLITLKSEINGYDIDYLTALKDVLSNVIDNKQQTLQKLKEKRISLRIEYDHSNEIQKKPYVAKLSVNEDGFLQREFFKAHWNTARFENKMLTIGEFTGNIKIGDVIEVREAPITNRGDAKEKRKYYLVTSNCLKVIPWGGYIKEYLKMYNSGIISLDTFLTKMLLNTVQNSKQPTSEFSSVPKNPYVTQRENLREAVYNRVTTPPNFGESEFNSGQNNPTTDFLNDNFVFNSLNNVF